MVRDSATVRDRTSPDAKAKRAEAERWAFMCACSHSSLIYIRGWTNLFIGRSRWQALKSENPAAYATETAKQAEAARWGATDCMVSCLVSLHLEWHLNKTKAKRDQAKRWRVTYAWVLSILKRWIVHFIGRLRRQVLKGNPLVYAIVTAKRAEAARWATAYISVDVHSKDETLISDICLLTYHSTSSNSW